MSGVKRRMNDYFESVPKKRRKIDINTTESKQKKWACSACTYDNEWWRTQCEICETKKEKKNENMVLAIKSTILVSTPKCITYNLKDKSTVLFYKSFLNETFCKLLFKEVDNIRYEQPKLFIYGKRIPIPRVQSWMSYKNVANKKASLYQKQECVIWTENMTKLKKELESICGVPFDYCLINKYRNGRDHCGYHADDEAKAAHCNVIASISLGQSRKFVLRHVNWKNDKKNKDLKHEFMLPNGSLIVMKDDTQKHWHHAIMKSTKLNNVRINLTFRQLK